MTNRVVKAWHLHMKKRYATKTSGAREEQEPRRALHAH